jgi:hypothetical protein
MLCAQRWERRSIENSTRLVSDSVTSREIMKLQGRTPITQRQQYEFIESILTMKVTM